MANDSSKTLEKLYIELGLDMSALQADILAADKTVTENLGRLNRQNNVIKVRMEADIAGLDRVKDAAQILTIQEQGLNQQLALSRDKLAILHAAYQSVANNQNSTAMAVQRAEQAWQKQRLEVNKLEQALKSLSAQRISLDASQLQDNISKLNARIQHIKIQADIDISKLKSASSAFDSHKIHVAAVTRELDLQRQKLAQLREALVQSSKTTGSDSVQTLNIKSNVMQQIQQINQLETKLKELQSKNINLQIHADSMRQVEQTVTDSIARINARLENIRVKTDIDVSKLGAAASEFDKAKAHVQGLNRELELQNQKLAEMKRALGNSISVNGLNNVKTINLHTDIQKQIQEIDRLKAKIDELNKIQPPKTNNLLSGYQSLKGNFAGKVNELSSAFTTLQGATSSADAAISATLGIIGQIPPVAGLAVAAFVGIPLAIKAIEHSLLELAKPAIAGGDAFYVMSRGMQLSIADMAQLSTIAKVTGIDINEVNSALRRFSMQMTKAGDDNSLARKALERYGAEIFDVNGRIKQGVDLSLELSKALLAAEEEGNGAAFRDIVGGKFWSGDFITYLEDLPGNIEQAKKVVKNGLANPTWAHAIQGEINTLNAQQAQLSSAFGSALMPVVSEIVPRATQRLGELTKAIAANKENIQFLGDAMALPVRMLNEFTDGIIRLSSAIDAAKDKESTLGKVFAKYGEYRDDISALMNVAPTVALTSLFSPVPIAAVIAQYRKEIDEFKAARAEAEAEAKTKNDEKQARIENSLGLSGMNEAQMQKVDSIDNERIKREQETADIIFKLNHSAYENNLHDLQRWKDEQLKIIEETEAELQQLAGKNNNISLDDARKALNENVAAKQLKIEQERETRLDEIRQRIAAADRTEFENKLANIETEKNAWIQAGMQRAEAERLAEMQKANYIQNIEQELSAAIQAINQSDLERKLAQIEREKQSWLDKGAAVSQAEELAQAQIRKAHEDTEKKLNEIRDSVAALDRSELENKLANIETEKNAWIQAGMEKAEAEELAQRKRQHIISETAQKEQSAFQSQMQERARAQEDYAKKVQAAQEEAQRKNEAIFNEALNLLKSESKELEAFMKGGEKGLQDLLYQKLLKSGVNPDQLKAMTPELLEKYKAAKGDAMQSFLPNWKDPYSPEPVDVPKSLNSIPPAASSAANALNRVADAANNVTNTSAENYSYSSQERGYDVAAFRNADGSVSIENVHRDAERALPRIDNVETKPSTAFNELPTAIPGVTQSLSDMTAPQFEQMNTPFAGMDQELQVTIQQINSMNAGVEAVTVRLNDLSAALDNLRLMQQENQYSTAQTRQPVNVNVTVQIQEAHAWDSEHIQELSERVADEIEPAIIGAIGGDDNSY